MDRITYQPLTIKNFNLNSLDEFIRRQDVRECLRRADGSLTLLPIAYIEDWNLQQRRETAKEILNELDAGGLAYGAFCENKVVGFAALSSALFGSGKQYMDLALFYVSEPFRQRGIGKELFQMACRGSRNAGARKLYISAHSAVESQAFYKAMGCVEAAWYHPGHVEDEPYDCQLECVI